MIVHLARVAALVLAATMVTACTQRSDEAPKNAEGTSDSIPAADVAQPPAAPVTEAVTPPPAAEAPAPAAAPAAPKPRTSASSASASAAASQAQKEALAKELAARDAAGKAAVAEQKAINQRQAETNAQLQKEVERLKPRVVTLPAVTAIPVRTIAELSTKNLSDGSTFEAQLDQDLVAGDVVVAKAGSRINGVVVTSDPGGKVKGVASLTVAARAVVGTKDNIIALKTDSYTAEAKSTKKKDAVRTGVASGIGAVIGGIAGGGKGAAIGAGVGAGAGVGTSMATRGDPAVIPAEELIQLKTTAPVSITIQP